MTTLYDVLHRLITRHGWASEQDQADAVAALDHVAGGGRITEEPEPAPAPPVDVPEDPSATSEASPA